jgi:hypothetical protein
VEPARVASFTSSVIWSVDDGLAFSMGLGASRAWEAIEADH